MSKALVRDLTLVRSRALREKLRQSPDIALALAVFVMQRQFLARTSTPGIDLILRSADYEADETTRTALSHIPQGDAPSTLNWLLAQPRDVLLSDLAQLVSSAIDLSHEGSSAGDRDKQYLADCLAAALDLDMRLFWSADRAFLTRLPKSELIKAFLSAPCHASLTEDQVDQFTASQSKRTKDDLAKSAADALEGAHWLPDILITPCAPGAFEVTTEGCAAVAAA